MRNIHSFIILLLLLVISCKPKSEADNQLELKDWAKEQKAPSDQFVNLDSLYDEVVYFNCRIDKTTDRIFAVKKNGLWGVSNIRNKLYIPINYDHITSTKQSLVLIKNGQASIYDPNLNPIVEVAVKNVRRHFLEQYVATTSTGQSLMLYDGTMIGDSTFSQITGPSDMSYYLGKKNNQWKPYDADGDPITEVNDIATDAANFLNNHKVNLYGYGPLRLGMSQGDVERLMKRKLTEWHLGENCNIFTLGNDFPRIDLMFNDESGKMRLERIYFSAPGILTKSGIGVGSTKAQVMGAYGSKIEMRPNKYNEFATDMFYVPSDAKDQKYRLNFHHNGQIIDSYSVGRTPSIFFVEGCL